MKMRSLRQRMGDLRAKRDEANDNDDRSVDVVPGFDNIVPNAEEAKPDTRSGKKVTFKAKGGY